MMADLLALPSAADVGLVCTNLRTLDGKRPIFVDRSDSLFFFPYQAIRFIEIHAASLADGTPATESTATPAEPPTAPETEASGDEQPLEIDEDFLRRIRDA